MNVADKLVVSTYDTITAEAAEAVQAYRSADAARVTRPEYKRLIDLVQSLSEDDIEALKALMVQRSIDAVCHFFSVMQGQTTIENMHDEDFSIYYGTEEVGRDILTNFLILDERRRPEMF